MPSDINVLDETKLGLTVPRKVRAVNNLLCLEISALAFLRLQSWQMLVCHHEKKINRTFKENYKNHTSSAPNGVAHGLGMAELLGL